MMPIEVYIDDIVRLRKVHPCGSYEWRVVRLGADIGLKCLGCGRRILLPRSTFERRLKTFVFRAAQPEMPPQSMPPDTALPRQSEAPFAPGGEDPMGEYQS